MKKTITLIFALIISTWALGQEFSKHVSSARTAYGSGDLEASRFAMQQALQELDIALSKEVLKLLPAKLEALSYNASGDDVTGASGLAGMFIHREYASGDKKASVEVISNSPLIASVNAILSLPLVGAATGQKVIKISGYKALVQKEDEAGKIYNLQLPLNSSLLTVRLENGTQDEVIRYASGLPVAQLAKMIQ
jgi:hypothetical protein